MLGCVIADIAGTELSEEDLHFLKHQELGGIILFTRNFKGRVQIKTLVSAIREIRNDLIICVDHEGGRVQRFREEFTRIPPMQTLGRHYLSNPKQALSYARELGWLMAIELLAVGIDHSFAPVVDLDSNRSQIIGDRAFSDCPETCVQLVREFIAGMEEAGMGATLKHFPGHGGVQADSHLELPVDERSWTQIKKRDLIPFTKLLPFSKAVMTAHIVFPQIDACTVSYSGHWLESILQDKFGFKGIIFSDDLTMEGAVANDSCGERANRALKAGCNALIVCNSRVDALDVLESVSGSATDVVSKLSLLQARKSTQDAEKELTTFRHSKAVEIAKTLIKNKLGNN